MLGLGGAFSVMSGGGVVTNGLLNNLIAYWPGNEAAGNALDLHVNALHLTDVNTVTSNPGLVYALARQYTAATTEYHTRPGDDALLSAGDTDFTIASWVRLDTVAATMTFAGKYLTVGNQREYRILYQLAANRIRLQISSNGLVAGIASLSANTLGVPAINTWYLVVAWHDSVGNTLNIEVNNTGIDSVAHATGIFDGTAAFAIAAMADPAQYMNGRIGPTMFWKSAGGGGGVLTVAQRTALYNGGAGLTYASFTV